MADKKSVFVGIFLVLIIKFSTSLASNATFPNISSSSFISSKSTITRPVTSSSSQLLNNSTVTPSISSSVNSSIAQITHSNATSSISMNSTTVLVHAVSTNTVSHSISIYPSPSSTLAALNATGSSTLRMNSSSSLYHNINSSSMIVESLPTTTTTNFVNSSKTVAVSNSTNVTSMLAVKSSSSVFPKLSIPTASPVVMETLGVNSSSSVVMVTSANAANSSVMPSTSSMHLNKSFSSQVPLVNTSSKTLEVPMATTATPISMATSIKDSLATDIYHSVSTAVVMPSKSTNSSSIELSETISLKNTTVGMATKSVVLATSSSKIVTMATSITPSLNFSKTSLSETISLKNTTVGMATKSVVLATGSSKIVNMTTSITPSLNFSKISQVHVASSSVAIRPSPTPLVNQTSMTASSATDNIVLVSSMYPCYITYVVTQTLNDTSMAVPETSIMGISPSIENSIGMSSVAKETAVTMATPAIASSSVAMGPSHSINPSIVKGGNVSMETAPFSVMDTTHLISPSPSANSVIMVTKNHSSTVVMETPVSMATSFMASPSIVEKQNSSSSLSLHSSSASQMSSSLLSGNVSLDITAIVSPSVSLSPSSTSTNMSSSTYINSTSIYLKSHNSSSAYMIASRVSQNASGIATSSVSYSLASNSTLYLPVVNASSYSVAHGLSSTLNESLPKSSLSLSVVNASSSSVTHGSSLNVSLSRPSISSPVVNASSTAMAHGTSSIVNVSSSKNTSIFSSSQPSNISITQASSSTVNISESHSSSGHVSALSPSATISPVSSSSVMKTPPLVTSSVNTSQPNATVSSAHTLSSFFVSSSVASGAKRRRRRAVGDPANRTVTAFSSSASLSSSAHVSLSNSSNLLSSSSSLLNGSSSLLSSSSSVLANGSSLPLSHISSTMTVSLKASPSPSIVATSSSMNFINSSQSQVETVFSSMTVSLKASPSPSIVSNTSGSMNFINSSHSQVKSVFSSSTVHSNVSSSVLHPTPSKTSIFVAPGSPSLQDVTSSVKMTLNASAISSSLDNNVTIATSSAGLNMSSSDFVAQTMITSSPTSVAMSVSMAPNVSMVTPSPSIFVNSTISERENVSSLAKPVATKAMTSSIVNESSASRDSVFTSVTMPTSSLDDVKPSSSVQSSVSHSDALPTSTSVFMPVTATPVQPSPLATTNTPSHATSVISSSVQSTSMSNYSSAQPTPAINRTHSQSQLPGSSMAMSYAKSSTKVNLLITTSSLGMCFVVYSTRIAPSPSPSSVMNMTSSVPISPSVSLNVSRVTSSIVDMGSSSSVVNVKPSSSSSAIGFNSSSAFVQPNSTISTAAVGENSTAFIQPSSSKLLPTLNASSTQVPKATESLKATSLLPSKTMVQNSTLVPMATSVSVTLETSSYMVNSTIRASSSGVIYPSVVTSSKEMTSSLTSSSVIASSTSSSSFVASLSSDVIKLSSSSTTSSIVSSSSSAISASKASSVTIVTSSVAITTVAPTTAVPTDSFVETSLEIERSENVNSAGVQTKVAQGLERAYNSRIARKRRRRATAGTEAKIYNITRKASPSKDAVVLFSIIRNGKTMSAASTIVVYDKINTLEELSQLIGYKVISRPVTYIRPTPPPVNATVFMILDKTARNLTVPAYRGELQDNMATYYKTQTKTTEAVVVTIFEVSFEKSGNTFLKFYVTEASKPVLALTVVEAFTVPQVTELTAALREPVVVGPYISGSVTAKKTDYSVLRMSVPAGIDLDDAKERNILEDKLAEVYVTGRAKGAKRKKRAVGSVSAKVVNVTAVQGSKYSDVTFYIVDSGKVVNSTYVTNNMNKLNTNEMTLITSPFAVTQAPKPVAQPIVATDTPPVTVAPVVIPYWIIAAVLGPILLLIIIILLIYWRWKSGAPTKVQPTAHKPEIIHKKIEPPMSYEAPRYVERKPPHSKIKTMSGNLDGSYDELPRRETSLRRKVTKAPYKRPISKTNAAYEESEEDDDITDVSRTGSRERIVKAQPGPGMKDKLTLSVPMKQPPKRRAAVEEETEDTLSDSESEEESIASTARTDQTSAAHVPTVAVMAGSSGHKHNAPIRFRSSVHPSSSLPPLQSKPLVAAQIREDTEDDSPRKSKRKSKVAQQELKQKADMERLRNKKRQRDRKNKIVPAQPSDRRAWHRDRLDQVLDPQPASIFGGKRKKMKGKKGTLATDEGGIELKRFQRNDDMEETETQDKEDSGESSDDSTISMEETRRRMHNLLDDAFSLLGPLSKQQQIQRNPSETMPLTRPPAPARYAGSRPALPEPPPAHGRATEPTPRQKRRLLNTSAFPQGLQQTQIGPGYPIRHPVRPPLVTKDPVVVWDPYDRQRYMDPRIGYQPTYSYRDPNGQNVFITPVQQQRDYMGAPLWSPYAAEDTMEEIYPDLAKASFPGAFDTSPSKDTFNPDFTSRDTTVDMSAGDTIGQRAVPLGTSPQPLIRSIKDELLRLSGPRRTPITEI